jgi:kynureninase
VHGVEREEWVRSLDAADPLRGFRSRFVIDDPDMCYLDGNSLGRLPLDTIDALDAVVRKEWGGELVGGWEHWVDQAVHVGDRLGEVTLAAESGQVLVTDTTSVNFYRLVMAALRDRPDRRTIVIDEANFPTDRYIVQGIAADLGYRVVVIPNEDPNVAECERITAEVIRPYLDDDVALVTLQVVNYRSGARQDVAALTELIHSHGAHVLWDASHAVGSIDLRLDEWGVQLAVGCTYKYCNAGPGAPAWMYIGKEIQQRLSTPIDGWFAQRDQFDMGPVFERAAGMRGFQIASPSILGLACVDAGLGVIAEAGMPAIEAKCAVGTDLMVQLYDEWLAPLGFALETPRDAALRGGHLSLTHPDAARIARALRQVANVVPDFRRPRTIRVAVSPLYTSYQELYTGFLRIRDLVQSGRFREIDAEGSRVT